MPKLRFKREDGTDYPEWEEKRIGEILTLCNGKDYKHLKKGDIPVMGTGGVITYVNEALCDWQCVCIGRKGTIDRPYFMDKPFWSVDTLFYSKPLGDNMPKFQYYLFQNINWLFYNEASGVPSLSASTIKNIIVKVPTVEEQQKIADFLSDVDEVIAQSEAEVANLQQQKKAAMQKIFSQEVRFKREDGTSYPEWDSKSFSDTFSSLNNNTFSRNMLSESGFVCNIHYGDIFVKYGEICDVQKENIPKVNDHIDTGKYDLLQDGDIILADTAEDETVGKATEILNVDTATVISGLHTMACRPNYKFAPMYLGYYINSPTYHNQLLPFMQGIKVTSIGRKNISETSISFPCLEEQQKIADFLATYDEAISCAKQELDNWKELKKGLLQQMFA